MDLKFWDNNGIAGNDQVFEHVDDSDLVEWVDKGVHETLNDWDDTWVSNVSKDGHPQVLPVRIFLVLGNDDFLELFNEVWKEFGFNDLSITEMSIDGNWVTGVSDVCVDTSLVQQSGQGKSSGRFDLNVLGINWSSIDEDQNFLQEFDGWCTDVHWECHDDTGSTLSNDDTFLDEIDEELDVGVCSSDGNGVNDDVTTGLVLFGLFFVSESVVNLFHIIVGEKSEDFSNGGDFGQSFLLSDIFFVSRFREVLNNFTHKLVNATFHAFDLEWGSKETVQWSIYKSWLGEHVVLQDFWESGLDVLNFDFLG